MLEHPPPPEPPGVDSDVWAAAVKAVREYCGWHIAPKVTEAVTVDGSGTSVQMLPTLHLVDLLAISNAGAPVSDPEWSDAGIVRGAWTSRYRGVVATMTHGYETWPADLVKVIAGMVADQSGQGRVSQVTSRSHQVSFDLDVDADQRRSVLDRYRLTTLR